MPLEHTALDSLLKEGPLERYQFKFILESNNKVKRKLAGNKKLEISFFRFFYGFGIIQGMKKDEIKSLQDNIELFKVNKTRNLVYVILLGITNHWVSWNIYFSQYWYWKTTKVI
jgi:hypothetical protein